MKCPICNEEAKLFAEVKPEGKIGCFCRNCKKGYVTKDPESGDWKEVTNLDLGLPKEVEKDLASYFSLDIDSEILGLAEMEFKMMITGEWEFAEDE